jgi:molybdenum cofactor synthesis domain-containing protein
MISITIITVSDRASRGEYEDLSGPEIERILQETGTDLTIRRAIVPDEKKSILKALQEGLGTDYILTTGGTGISPSDITPDVCRDFCDKDLPGVAELLRRESWKETPNALLSRGYAGVKGSTIIINFPGSVKAVRLCTGLITPILEHGVKMLAGGGHS